jgi:hypothetical protein
VPRAWAVGSHHGHWQCCSRQPRTVPSARSMTFIMASRSGFAFHRSSLRDPKNARRCGNTSVRCRPSLVPTMVGIYKPIGVRAADNRKIRFAKVNTYVSTNGGLVG